MCSRQRCLGRWGSCRLLIAVSFVCQVWGMLGCTHFGPFLCLILESCICEEHLKVITTKTGNFDGSLPIGFVVFLNWLVYLLAVLGFTLSASQRKQFSKKFQFLENHSSQGSQDLASRSVCSAIRLRVGHSRSRSGQLVQQPRPRLVSVLGRRQSFVCKRKGWGKVFG